MKKYKYTLARMGFAPILRLTANQLAGGAIMAISFCVLMAALDSGNELHTSASILTGIVGLIICNKK